MYFEEMKMFRTSCRWSRTSKSFEESRGGLKAPPKIIDAIVLWPCRILCAEEPTDLADPSTRWVDKDISKPPIVESTTTDFIQKKIESWEGKLTKDLGQLHHSTPKEGPDMCSVCFGQADVLNVPWLAFCASMFPICHTQPLPCPSLQSIQSDGAKVDHSDPSIRARALQSLSSVEAVKAQVSHRLLHVGNMGPSVRPKKWISEPTSFGSRPVWECYQDMCTTIGSFLTRGPGDLLASWQGRVHAKAFSIDHAMDTWMPGCLKNIQESVFEFLAAHCSSVGPPGSSCQKRRIWMAFPEAGCLA